MGFEVGQAVECNDTHGDIGITLHSRYRIAALHSKDFDDTYNIVEVCVEGISYFCYMDRFCAISSGRRFTLILEGI